MTFVNASESIQGMILSELKQVVLHPLTIDKLRKKIIAVRILNATENNYQVGQTVAIKDSLGQSNEDAPLFARITRVDVCFDNQPSLRIFLQSVAHPLPTRVSL